jgi:hypothetical protein
MAIRYVKDFEFPAAAGFSASNNTTPAKMAKQPMYAKGGAVSKPGKDAPKGALMIVIDVGPPKRPAPMKKAEGGYADMDDYMSRLERESPIQSGTYGKKKPAPAKKKKMVQARDVEASDLYDAEDLKRLERGYAKGGKIQYDDNGEDTSVPVKDVKSGKVKQSRDADYYREMEQAKRSKMMKKSGKVHDDAAMDKALIKKMVKPEARKMMNGGKVKTAYADGGSVMAAGAMDPAMNRPMMKNGGGVKPPLSRMSRSKSVPVASRAPMIASPSAQMAAPRGGVGVGQSRPGRPNVGSLRAAMAKATTAANPENAPALMKRGGMTKGTC